MNSPRGICSGDCPNGCATAQSGGLLPEQSLQGALPSLIIQPFHQSGSVVSLRQFTNNAFNHHHGVQAEEGFGAGMDADGCVDEFTRADITALKPVGGVVMVPALTDLKLHDITSGPGDPNREALNINEPGGSPGFLGGNRRFLTKKLWGAANERPYFHHGKFTTLREATLAHGGEARASRNAFGLPSCGGPPTDIGIRPLK